MKTSQLTVHLGFEVGTGAPVEIPLAHTFVTGQTQLSGKTTALRAIVERAGRRALAFVTKRGETFDGRRIRPYLPAEGHAQIPWRLVETVMAASLGQRNMKWERGAIVTAAKGATTLQEVRDNVARLRAKTKNPKTEELYMLLGEYLDLVLPEMASLNASHALVLEPGLNVMDLTDVGTQTQAMVIRAALENINRHGRDILTVFPEAWEFAPRNRSAPAKDEAIAMARKGAVLKNFLLCDSQDLAGVDTVIRQAASVWLLGVQRELNELKRTLQMIPAGVKRPKPEEVAQLELGQFYACWGRHAVKTYVQPSWMDEDMARKVALGSVSIDQAARHYAAIARDAAAVERRFLGRTRPQKEDEVNAAEAKRLTDDNARLKAENADLRRRLDALEAPDRSADQRHADPTGRAGHQRGAGAGSTAPAAETRQPDAPRERARASHPSFSEESENLYQTIKARLIDEAPSVLQLLTARPELEVRIERRIIEAEGESTLGRVAKLLKAGFLEEKRRFREILKELERTGTRINNKSLSIALQELVVSGFLTKESVDAYRGVEGMTVHIVEA